jgi:hypothetical protein
MKDLSGVHAAKAIDCGRGELPVELAPATDSPSECALRAVAERKPFHVRFYCDRRGFYRDRQASIRFQGFAGDREGNLYGLRDSVQKTLTPDPTPSGLVRRNLLT